MKKLISKFFRVATEGATTDGRAITAAQIDQMAKNYNPLKYSARIWLEHFRSLLPDSPFKAYGDVLALKAETVDGKRVLLAQISPTPELVAMNQARQKLFSSIEMAPDFAGTGEAYMMGLAVTDSPASLGTEMMEFSAKAEKSPLAERKQNPANLFTATSEVSLEFSEEEVASTEQSESFMDKIKELLGTGSDKQRKDFNAALEPLRGAITAIAESQRDLLDQFSKLQPAPAQDNTQVTELSAKFDEHLVKFNELLEKLSATPGSQGTQRPPASGGDTAKTDC